MAAHHPRRGQRKQTIMRKAGDAVEGLGRWFGVAGDQTDMEMTKRQYRETWKHSNASLGNRGRFSMQPYQYCHTLVSTAVSMR